MKLNLMTKTKIKSVLFGFLQIAILIFGTLFLLDSGAKTMDYQWQWERVPSYLFFFEQGRWWPAELIEGLFITLEISAISMVFCLLIGLVTALLRQSDSIIGRSLSFAYVQLIRNSPLLVQIYVLYFVLGPVLGLGRFATGVLALSLFQGAYTAEIFRAGLASIPAGQIESAQSLGLSKWRSYYHIILPQVVRRVLPPLTNEMISLIKNSSIVSVMAIFDLTTQGRNIVSEIAMPFEIWFTVAAIYLMLTLSLSALSAWLERRYSIAQGC